MGKYGLVKPFCTHQNNINPEVKKSGTQVI